MIPLLIGESANKLPKHALSAGGNLRDFINYIWETKGWLKGDQWIVGIECGTEIMEGQGSWNVSSYWLKP